MSLRLEPQDVVVALKIATHEGAAQTPFALATALHMSEDEIRAGLDRLELCQLYGARSRRVIRRNLAEFLIAGLRYVFPGQLGELGRGMPTSILGSPTLSARFLIGDDENEQERNVVWPVDGDAAQTRGRLLTPPLKWTPSFGPLGAVVAEADHLRERVALLGAVHGRVVALHLVREVGRRDSVRDGGSGPPHSETRLRTASSNGVDFGRRRQLLVFDRFLARIAREFAGVLLGAAVVALAGRVAGPVVFAVAAFGVSGAKRLLRSLRRPSAT